MFVINKNSAVLRLLLGLDCLDLHELSNGVEEREVGAKKKYSHILRRKTTALKLLWLNVTFGTLVLSITSLIFKIIMKCVYIVHLRPLYIVYIYTYIQSHTVAIEKLQTHICFSWIDIQSSYIIMVIISRLAQSCTKLWKVTYSTYQSSAYSCCRLKLI